MDYIKLSSFQTSSQFNFSHSHNQSKVIKFLLSISMFSILLSYSSLASLLLRFFSSFSSSSSMNFLSYTFDKNSMFLLCNGLLVFIVKNSGLIGTSPPGFTSNLSNEDEIVAPKHSKSAKNGFQLAEKKSEKKAEEAKEEIVHVEIEEEGVRKDEILVRVEEEDHEVYEEEGVELLSAEELKKKCDEFIKKMKEGIKLEVRQSIMC